MSTPSQSVVGACFLGEHEYAIDRQRRLALPKEWRRGEQWGAGRFFVLPGRDQSLQLIPGDMFEELLAKLRRVSFADAEASRALATIGSLAQEATCDGQGRIGLTANLMAHADLKDRAVLLGSVTTVQIWRPEAWAQQRMDSETGLNVLQALQERPDDFSEAFRNAVRN